ncbi:hypothetical protein R6Q57_019695 [Mikania cordata]
MVQLLKVRIFESFRSCKLSPARLSQGYHALLFSEFESEFPGRDIKTGFSSWFRYKSKDRKTKLKKNFDKEGGYDNTERAKQNPPKGMDSEAWVQVIDGLFTTSTYKNRSLKNTANRSKQLYGSYHGTQSYAQRRYDEVKEGGVPQHVEGWRDMHFKGSLRWYNQLAEQHWQVKTDIGDLGVQGMALPIEKLDMYVVAARINPQKIHAIMLDVGTNNKQLLENPLFEVNSS